MSEKTPRQLGAEAETLRKWHGHIEGRLANAQGTGEHHQEWADYYGKIASGDDTEREDGDTTSAEEARELGQRSLELVANNQPHVDYYAEQSVAHNQKAAEHYKQNAAIYHELGVHEAALDGVHINIQQSEDAQDHVEIKQI